MPRLRPLLGAVLATVSPFAGATPAHYTATGYDRLVAEYGATLPSAAGLALNQTEAPLTENGYDFAPDTTAFPGKAFTLHPSSGTVSSHATWVGDFIYGATDSFVPAADSIRVYLADNWITSLLRYGAPARPITESALVENHSWISTTSDNDAQTIDIIRRLDYLVIRDDVLVAVGVNNGASASLPALLCQAYNVLSVGRTDGQHSAGLTTFDGAGRFKPELVAPGTVTSTATPMVASAALLLRASARAASNLGSADSALVVRAILLAGTSTRHLPAWHAASADQPLDPTFGAGELNLYLAHQILRAGPQPASDSATIRGRGWHLSTTPATGSTRHYFFEIPAGDTAPDFAAALVWDRSVTATTFWTGVTAALPHLALRLYSANDYNLGPLVALGANTLANLQFFRLPALPPGRYALEVTGDTAGTPFALAWTSLPTVSVTAPPVLVRSAATTATFTFTRAGDTADPLQIFFDLSGTAQPDLDYTAPAANSVTFPAYTDTVTLDLPLLPTSANTTPDAALTLSLVPDYASSLDASATATTLLPDNPYQLWRYDTFGPSAFADPALSGDTADPDSDGLPNFLEYAFARDPLVADPTPPVVLASAGDTLTLTWFEPATRADVTFTPEWSDDLAAWHADSFTEFSRAPATDGTTITVAIPATATRRFLHLRVETAP